MSKEKIYSSEATRSAGGIGQSLPIPPAAAPFHRIGIDLLGRFPKSGDGNKWIVLCTDYLTRYAVTRALPTAEATQIAEFLLEDIILKHGAPRVIITDRGQVFQSKLVSDINRLCNIIHRMTTAYHPQTIGKLTDPSWYFLLFLVKMESINMIQECHHQTHM
ncbi:uncharacterized protein K02A2.6-like [Argiope bruennichi]|uniref:uncharacterized protein K02A2.6-like n=1 Tax=Argiope bruennichi TaxID=94029 RepID=UPI00249569B9|nr:uncharacterized protein K02A2.6-like [Argiope bruennichi]